jgi:hypothetical protein
LGHEILLFGLGGKIRGVGGFVIRGWCDGVTSNWE